MAAAPPQAPSPTPPSAEKQALAAQVRGLVMSQLTNTAIHALASLRIPDLLSTAGDDTSAMPCSELARSAGAHEPSLYRVLRLAAGAGYLRELPGQRFALTPLGACLRSDDSSNLRALVLTVNLPSHVNGRANVLQALKSGSSCGFEAWQGKDGPNVFEWFGQNPGYGSVFYDYMSSTNKNSGLGVAANYDFGQHSKVVDVGGGEGLLATQLLQAHPGLREAVVVDLAKVVEAAPAAPADVKGRLRYVAGDFFKPLPAEAQSADCYVLKWVLHDWNDAQAADILRNVRAAMAPGARLVLVEHVVPSLEQRSAAAAPNPAVMMDFNMLVLCPGRERTEAEWRDLLSSCGFSLEQSVPVPGPTPLFLLLAAPK